MNQSGASTAGAAHARGSDVHLRDLVNLVRRNLWLILAVAAVVIGGTAYLTWTAAPVYEARATIHVEQDRPVSPELDFVSNLLRGSDVETEMALLRARSIAEQTVDTLSLQVQVVRPRGVARSALFADLSASRTTRADRYRIARVGDQYRVTDRQDREIARVSPGEATVFNGIRMVLAPDQGGWLPDEIVLAVADYPDAVEDLTRRLSVGRPYRDANLIAVSYQGWDPELVHAVPNMISRLFIAQRNAAKKTEAVSTVAFLNEQIGYYTEQLEDAEEALLAFQQGAQVVDLQAEGAEQVRRLVEFQSQRDILEADRSSLRRLLREIDAARVGSDQNGPSPFRRLASYPTFLQNQAVTELMSQLNELQAERTAMAEQRQARHPDMVALDQQITQLEDQLYQLAVNYEESLSTQIASLEGRLEEFGQQLERIPEKEVQEERLQRQREVLDQVFKQLQSRLKEAEIAQAVEPGDVRVVDAAVAPREPIRPRKVRSMLLAVIFGLVLGIGVAATRDYMDETIHTREELGNLSGLPVLGVIPRIKGGADSNGKRPLRRREKAVEDRLITRSDVGNPVSEAYRAFRTNITFLDIDHPPKVFVLTSPGPAEGKSTSAANLAITLAQQNTSTLLMDCDLRRGIVHRVFGSPKEPGLTNVLRGEVALEEAVNSVDVGTGQMLDFLSTGTLPPNPSEVLGSNHMRELLTRIRRRYDLVLVDSTPLNLVTDAAVLGTAADGVILIVRAGTTEKGALRFAREQLEAVRAPISGVVLNDVDFTGRGKYYGSGAGYGYYYRYYRADT